AIAAAAIGVDHQTTGRRIRFRTHRLPPAANSVDRKSRRIMIDPDADPADILARVVDAIRNSLALFRVDEIVNLDFLWRSLGEPLTPVVFVVSDEFLLLGVDGNHRIAARLERLDLVV